MWGKNDIARISDEKALELIDELEKGGVLVADDKPAFPLKK